MTGEEPGTRAAGRTDAGVHALGQVACFATGRDIPVEGFRKGLCSMTPADLSVRQADEAPPDFDARHHARGKHYRYRFVVGPCPSALRHRYTHWVARPLDVGAMAEGAAHLVGQHDFGAFQAADDARVDAVRTITRLEVHRLEDEVMCDVYGDGFLKNMVRIIAGTLMLVGLGQRAPGWVGDVLRSRDRTGAGPTAPPGGLCLMQVFY